MHDQSGACRDCPFRPKNPRYIKWPCPGSSRLSLCFPTLLTGVIFGLPKTWKRDFWNWLAARKDEESRMMWSVEGLSCWVVELRIVIGWGQADRKRSANVAWGECTMEWRSLWKKWTSRGAWREPRSWATWAGCEPWSPGAPLWMEMRTRDTLHYIMLLAMAMSKLASSLCRYSLSLSLSLSFCMLFCLWFSSFRLPVWRWSLVVGNRKWDGCRLLTCNSSSNIGGSQTLDNRLQIPYPL